MSGVQQVKYANCRFDFQKQSECLIDTNIIRDVKRDIDNWRNTIQHVESNMRFDPTVLRKMMIQSYTLMHNVTMCKVCTREIHIEAVFAFPI